MTLFVDSSAWFAAANPRDRHHDRAKVIFRDNPQLVTTDHVAVETYLLMASRLSERAARSFWSALEMGHAGMALVSREDMSRGFQIQNAFADQSFSMVDCTSFAVMNRLNLTRVVSFDTDFLIYRYGTGRERAFDVLR